LEDRHLRANVLNNLQTVREMKLFWNTLISMIISTFHLSARAESVGGIDFPANLAGFELRSVVDHESAHPGLGFALLYNAPGLKASVFVYDHSVKNIPDGADSSVAHRELLEANGNIELIYSDVRVLQREELTFVAEIPYLHSVYLYNENKSTSRGAMRSHLYLTAWNGNFVKIRITYSATERVESSDRMQDQFLEELSRLMRR
jgi:hypothetical protein